MADRFYPTPHGEMPSVTTILSILAKLFLLPWALRMAREALGFHLVDLVNLLQGGDKECITKISKLLDHCFTAHERVAEESTTIGNQFHQIVQCLQECGIERKKLKQYIRTIEGCTTFPPEVVRMVYSWASLVIKYKVVLLSSEVFVYSTTYRYGGTLDGTWVIDGEEYVIDYKTSNGIGMDYLYQTEAYRRAHNELFKTNIKRRAIVWIRKTGEAMLIRIDPARNGHDWQGFLAAKRLYDDEQSKATGRLWFDRRQLSDRTVR